MNLVFLIRKQKIKRIGSDEIAGFARNHIYATFDFDELWEDLEKYAIFVSADKSRSVVRLGYGKELSCIVPKQVLEGTYFKVSVFGGDLLTSTQSTILLSSSGYISEIDDMDIDDIIENTTTDYMKVYRKKHFDEDIDVRLNKFEISEHPHL